MPRTVLNPQARLTQLRIAKKRADAHPVKATLTAEPMAKLLGVSWQGALRRWCNELPGFEQSGCFVRGGQGIEWTFKVRRTTDWLIRHFEREEQALKAGAEKIRQVLAQPEQAAPINTWSEAKKALDVSAQVEEQKVRAGQLVEAQKVEEYLREEEIEVRDDFLSLPERVDPQGKMPQEWRDRLIQSVKDTLIQRHQRKRDRLHGALFS